MSETLTESSFASLGLPTQILTILGRHGFVTPTPIQEQSIPLGLAGHDILGIAQTGTGKTLAFGLPMLAALKDRRGMGLVVVPTRELALQVDETLRKIGGPLQIKTAVLIGGAPMHRQVMQIRGGAHIIVATPGRLADHLKQGSLRLDRMSVAVLDEADRMLDMGFLPEIRRIMERLPSDRQTMLFSATMPPEIEALTHNFMRGTKRVEIARAGTAAELVEQNLLVVPHDEKAGTLHRLLDEADGTVLVFARTRHGARKVARMVRDFGFSAAELHSDRSLAQRREALEGFKGGTYRVLVATDIAARGIDVKRIELVVNFDVPDNPEDYVHRIGRTGRAGETGRAVTIATPEQKSMVWDIERILGQEIPLSPESPLRIEARPAHRGGNGGRRSGSSGSRPSASPRPPRQDRPREPRAVAQPDAPRGEKPRNSAGPSPSPSTHGKSAKPMHPTGPASPAQPARTHRGQGAPVAAKKKRHPEGPHPYEKFFRGPKRG
jgi:ATP-dependent RNA helicase RhlE